MPLKDSGDINTPPTPTFHEEEQLAALHSPVVIEQPEIADEPVKAAAAEQDSLSEGYVPEVGEDQDPDHPVGVPMD